MSIDYIELWHRRARPKPTEADLDVQVGCHIEEFVEMLDAMSIAVPENSDVDFGQMMSALDALANGLKNGTLSVNIDDRKEFLDSIADQIVTGTGVGYCAGMKPALAVTAVNRSNWSKFDNNGMPIFNEHGKVAKGPDYVPPDLEGLY
jgi:predicted HAD superfamily Cof-like phosphohydrolase